MIFAGSEFFYYDIGKNKWDIGDIGNKAQMIPDNCAVTILDSAVHKNNQFSLIVTGGFFQGAAYTIASGLRFAEEEHNGVKSLISDVSVDFAALS